MDPKIRQFANLIVKMMNIYGSDLRLSVAETMARELVNEGNPPFSVRFADPKCQQAWSCCEDTVRLAAKQIVAELKKERAVSNVNHAKAKALWLKFHGDERETLGWDNMQEKSRQKWVDFSDKLEAEKVMAVLSAVGMPNTMVASGSGGGASKSQPAVRSLVDRQLDRIRTMPPLIRAMTQDSNAWVVGSQAEFREDKINIKPTSDWDVIVPYAEWQDAMTRLASAGALEKASFTSVGGVRTTIPAKSGGTIGLDIWPGEISSHMMKPFTHVAWQPKTGAVWVRGE